MALYKYSDNLIYSNNRAFDKISNPGHPAPFSGIYKCVGCGKEIPSIAGHPLPSQNHHEHTSSQETIRWKLIVYADHQGK